jgi:hypothetical protein
MTFFKLSPHTPVIVRLGNTASLCVHDGALIHSGGGAVPKYLPVSGIVSALTPTLALSVSGLQGFTAVQGLPSFTQTYTVAGVNLTGAVTVVAPADYELSSEGLSFAPALVLQPTNGNLNSIPVEVWLAASAHPGALAGILTHSGGGAPPQNLTLSGTVSSAFGIAMSETYGLSGTDAAPGADPDGDGLSNVQEFAFGLNPTIPSGNPVIQVPATGAVAILYLQRVGVTYSVDSSDDMTNWSAGAITPVASSPHPPGLPPGYTQYKATLPVTSGKGFLRVRAVVP